MNIIFRIIGFACTIYSIAIVIRLLASWIQADHQNTVMGLLHTITEPYLAFFRRLGIFRSTGMDFSPLLALAVLSFITRFFLEVDLSTGIRPFGVLSLLLVSLWSAVSFILGFFFIIFLLRLFSLKTAKDSYLPLWATIARISEPAEDFINKLVYSGEQFDYGRLLITGALLALGSNIAGTLIVALARLLLGKI